MDSSIRLQKWLSELGVASRREAEAWIKEGRLQINNNIAALGDKVRPQLDKIYLDNKLLKKKVPPKVYWLLHKPDKFLTSRAREDGKHRIFDLPMLAKNELGVFPVGRLDYRTEGLLLMTNDGELCHRLCHPSYKVPRFYQVLTIGKLSKEQLRQIRNGLELADGKVRCDIKPAQGVNLGKSKGNWYFITVYEGRNRLVRRIFEHFQLRVNRLIRYGYGDLRLSDKLAAGSYRQLNSQEIKYLKSCTKLSAEKQEKMI